MLFVPFHNAGGHFLDWSLQYVCGELPWHTNKIDLVGKRNWHNHESTMVHGFQEFLLQWKQLQQQSVKNFENIYVMPLSLVNAVHQMHGLTIDKSSHQQRQEAICYMHDDTIKMLTWAQDHDMMPVIVDYTFSDWYSVVYNDRSPEDLAGRPTQDLHQAYNQYIDCFFDRTPQCWDQDNIWDRREQLALILRFENLPLQIDLVYNAHRPHLLYNTDDIWNNLPAVLQEICAELGLKFYHDRFQHWQPVYQQWREVHDPYFGRHLDRIIDAIVYNKYLSLKRFRMGFWHEVLIQNRLLLKHQLNLRTWQLEKFPDNTQALHQLLEPSIHSI